jgi:hypothetical protein
VMSLGMRGLRWGDATIAMISSVEFAVVKMAVQNVLAAVALDPPPDWLDQTAINERTRQVS